jgi:hypothetical protein
MTNFTFISAELGILTTLGFLSIRSTPGQVKLQKKYNLATYRGFEYKSIFL